MAISTAGRRLATLMRLPQMRLIPTQRMRLEPTSERLDRACGVMIGKIEVLNVKSDQVAQFIQQKGIYPAFHMNKKYWVSIPLDGTIADED